MKNLKKFVCNLDVIISGLSLCAIVVITLAGVIMRNPIFTERSTTFYRALRSFPGHKEPVKYTYFFAF